jgi:hypothetical protein
VVGLVVVATSLFSSCGVDGCGFRAIGGFLFSSLLRSGRFVANA